MPAPGTPSLAASLSRIEGRLDEIAADTRDLKASSIKSGAIAGGVAGALVAAAVALIRAQMGA